MTHEDGSSHPEQNPVNQPRTEFSKFKKVELNIPVKNVRKHVLYYMKSTCNLF